MIAKQRQALFDDTARAIKCAPDVVVQGHLANRTASDPDDGAGVAEAISALG
jgi:catalase